MAVVIETTLGDLTVDLFIEERPRACQNFLKLCKIKYYNFNLFHNVEHDFIAQTGDPTGAGDGGESIWGVLQDKSKRYFEAESLPKIRHSSAGLLSLVSVGDNMVGSQFFFTLADDLMSLDGVHCVIGEVTEGHEVLRKLNEAIVDEKFRPYQDIRVTHTVILEDPFDDPKGIRIPSRSPSPNPDRMQNGRIGADEEIHDTEGKSGKEIQEMLADREAKARATILEIVGDLPDAEIAPPENVLFVCKLNPVTTDDDLEIIFSRFGKVKGCEVIRDKYTGDSLQYAFVEFEDQKSCENAYFKMDNVLIDDRRIHVDFSQSVAKVKWRGKGRGVVHENDGNGKLNFNDLRAKDGRRRSPQAQRRMRDRSRDRSGERRNDRGQDHRDRSNYNRDRNYDQRKSRTMSGRDYQDRNRDRERYRHTDRSRERYHDQNLDQDRRDRNRKHRDMEPRSSRDVRFKESHKYKESDSRNDRKRKTKSKDRKDKRSAKRRDSSSSSSAKHRKRKISKKDKSKKKSKRRSSSSSSDSSTSSSSSS